MLLNKDYKLERIDKNNIALFKGSNIKKRGSRRRIWGGREWKPVRYYPTWGEAIENASRLLKTDFEELLLKGR
jgi:hypothetical protein